MGKKTTSKVEKKEIKEEPKAKKGDVSMNSPEEMLEGILRTEAGYVIKFADKREEFIGDEQTALNEAIKRYKIFLTE